jgi:hypothetical protein
MTIEQPECPHATETMIGLSPRRSWPFAISFAVLGFLAGGSVVFYLGFRAFAPPPPPPGTAGCGNQVMGGFVVMVFGAPIGAMVCSMVTAVVGGILDSIVHFFRDTWRKSETTPPARRKP